MQLSDTSFARHTLEGQFFRYKPSFVGQSSTCDSRHNSKSRPFFNVPVYSSSRTYAMEPLSREELERFQKLSNDYEPEVQVSFVGRPYSLLILDTYDVAGPTGITQAIESNYLL